MEPMAKPAMYRKNHHQATHRRWAEVSPVADGPQCGACTYWIPLTGSWGTDWGACSNPRAAADRRVVFEHFGCADHESAGSWRQPVEQPDGT